MLVRLLRPVEVVLAEADGRQYITPADKGQYLEVPRKTAKKLVHARICEYVDPWWKRAIEWLR